MTDAVDGPAFLCDEMVSGLARWLRMAGYDTTVAEPGESDAVLLARARRQHRILLTRDRALLQHRGARRQVFFLAGEGLSAWQQELSERLALDWCHQPFSRCLLCNTPLVQASDDMRERVPPEFAGQTLLHCPSCDKVYWSGGHVRRMSEALRELNGENDGRRRIEWCLDGEEHE